MRRASPIYSIAAGLGCLVFSLHGRAASTQTVGAGTAVSVSNLSATFDSLTANHVVHLDTYTEGGLRITTSGDSWAADNQLAAKLDPFWGANDPDRAFYAIAWGNQDWVTIETTNHARIYGVEFTIPLGLQRNAGAANVEPGHAAGEWLDIRRRDAHLRRLHCGGKTASVLSGGSAVNRLATITV